MVSTIQLFEIGAKDIQALKLALLNTLRVGALGFLLLCPTSQALAWVGGTDDGQGGCCGLPESMIVRLAEAASVDPNITLGMIEDLDAESVLDLTVLQSTSRNACAAYSICDEIPEDFFRVILGLVIQQKNTEAARRVEIRGIAFTSIAAIFGLIGAGLGIFNTVQAQRDRDNRAKGSRAKRESDTVNTASKANG